MKKLMNEWRKFANEAEQISEEQKDPEKISQARLAGATDYREHGSMERGDDYLKMDNGEYFSDYEDAYYTAQEAEDYGDSFAELEEELDERCQKGYKTHPTRKTKKMYGKTYRNCVKAEE